MRYRYAKFLLVPAMTAMIALGACSSTKETLGLNKQSPDEFKVLKRAPLAMPPDYALRPPAPGAPRPQEQAAAQEAAQTVFGATPQAAAQPSDSGGLLLQQAGAAQANPDIRNVINSETEMLNEVEKPVAKKLLGIGFGSSENQASLVNAREEAERLKQNEESGQPATAGETPVIED